MSHQFRHVEIKPFSCNHCGKRFKRSEGLEEHNMNYHTQLNPFMCGICEQTFPREQNLKSHVRNVHSAEPKAYSCDACGKWCKQKLSVHKQRCPGKNGWECALCKKLFATKSGLLALCSLILRRNHTNATIVVPHLNEKMDYNITKENTKTNQLFRTWTWTRNT